jgi:hypothetical protein
MLGGYVRPGMYLKFMYGKVTASHSMTGIYLGMAKLGVAPLSDHRHIGLALRAEHSPITLHFRGRTERFSVIIG